MVWVCGWFGLLFLDIVVYVWCWYLGFLSLGAVCVLLLLVVGGYGCGVGGIAALAWC